MAIRSGRGRRKPPSWMGGISNYLTYLGTSCSVPTQLRHFMPGNKGLAVPLPSERVCEKEKKKFFCAAIIRVQNNHYRINYHHILTTTHHTKIKMYATRVVRQAAHAAERTPLIKFIGRRSIPGEFFFFFLVGSSRVLWLSRTAIPNNHPRVPPTVDLGATRSNHFTQSLASRYFPSQQAGKKQTSPSFTTASASNTGSQRPSWRPLNFILFF